MAEIHSKERELNNKINHRKKYIPRGGLNMAQKLSDEARQHKNEYNAEYVKQTKGAAQRKWNEENKERKKQKSFFLWLPQDQDILEHLDAIDNVSGYIKDLIRADINR